MIPAPASRRSSRGGLGPATIVAVTVVVVLAVLAAVLVVLRIRARPFAYIIGDSITFDTSDAFRTELEPSYLLAIDGRPGARADELVEPARSGTDAGRPGLAVINLGTNDVNMAWPPDATRRAFEQFAEIFSGLCVAVVTVNEFMPDPASRPRAVELNRWLKAWARDHGYRVIDWSATVQSRLTTTDPAARLTTDGIHPTGSGARELASAYHQALGSC